MRVTLFDLARCFLQVSFSSVGGAQAPLRYYLTVDRKWLDQEEFAETFGICQTLPGAVGANVAMMVGDRYAGWRGGLIAVLAFSLPAMIVAVFLAMGAINRRAGSPRIAHAEIAVAAPRRPSIGNTAAALSLAGEDRPDRSALVPGPAHGCHPIGLVMVVVLHLALPYAVIAMLGFGLILERIRAMQLLA